MDVYITLREGQKVMKTQWTGHWHMELDAEDGWNDCLIESDD